MALSAQNSQNSDGGKSHFPSSSNQFSDFINKCLMDVVWRRATCLYPVNVSVAE